MHKVIQMLQRPDGATLEGLMKATGWQAHSVRGFLSAALSKKMGLEVGLTILLNYLRPVGQSSKPLGRSPIHPFPARVVP